MHQSSFNALKDGQLVRPHPFARVIALGDPITAPILEVKEALLKECEEYHFPADMSLTTAQTMKTIMISLAALLENMSKQVAKGLISQSDYHQSLAILLEEYWHLVRGTPLDYTLNPHSPMLKAVKRIAKEIQGDKALIEVIMPGVTSVIGGVMGSLKADTEEEHDIDFTRFIVSDDGQSLIDIAMVVNYARLDPPKLFGADEMASECIFPLTLNEKERLKLVSDEVKALMTYIEDEYVRVTGGHHFYTYLSRLYLALRNSSKREQGSDSQAHLPSLQGPLRDMFRFYRQLSAADLETIQQIQIHTGYGARSLKQLLLFLFCTDDVIKLQLTEEEMHLGLSSRTFHCTDMYSGYVHRILISPQADVLKTIQPGEDVVQERVDMPAELGSLSQRRPMWKSTHPVSYYVTFQQRITRHFLEGVYARGDKLQALVDAYMKDGALKKELILAVLEHQPQREHIASQSIDFTSALYDRLTDDEFKTHLPHFDNQLEKQYQFFKRLSLTRQLIYIEQLPEAKLKRMLNADKERCLHLFLLTEDPAKMRRLIRLLQSDLIDDKDTFTNLYAQVPEALQLDFLMKIRPAESWLPQSAVTEAQKLYLKYRQMWQGTHAQDSKVVIAHRLLASYIGFLNRFRHSRNQYNLVSDFLSKTQPKNFPTVTQYLEKFIDHLRQTFTQREIDNIKPTGCLMARLKIIAALAGVDLKSNLQEIRHVHFLPTYLDAIRLRVQEILAMPQNAHRLERIQDLLRVHVREPQPLYHYGFFAHRQQPQAEVPEADAEAAGLLDEVHQSIVAAVS